MKYNKLLALCFSLMVILNSCSVIGGIFKAGVWVGILIVAVIVIILVWIIGKSSGK